MIVRPYRKGDEENFNIQPSQDYMDGHLDRIFDNSEKLVEHDAIWTVEQDGEIFAIGGVIPMWENRGQAWMIVAENAGEHMTSFYRAVRRHIIESPYRRIEATVDVGFKPGVRLMKMLGFEMEGYLKAYRPDGKDMLLFARVAE